MTRQPLGVLGRIIGTAEGWDGDGTEWLVFYKFLPAEGVTLPPCDLSFSYDEGVFYTTSDEGERTETWDMIEVLKDLKKE